jgi:DNA-binding MarR family transcriptional regulator
VIDHFVKEVYYLSQELAKAKQGNLGQVLLRAARLYNEHAVALFQKFEPRFTLAHTTLMPHLDLEGTRPSELARRMGTSKQAVGQLVNDLEKLGVLERVPDPSDGRARLVVFTEEGMRLMVQGLGVLKQVEEEVTQSLGCEAVEELKQSLEAVVNFFEKPTGPTSADARP